MDRTTCLLILLIFALESVCASKRFFISAPKVFHVNVKEKVFVQTSSATTLYLEDERSGQVVSDKKTTSSNGGAIQTVELMIERERMAALLKFKSDPYLLLVAETPVRKMTRVLVSMHRGHLFIQTNQPLYKPSDQVQYRIFALDHTMRPSEELIEISVINPSGIRLKLDSSLRAPFGGMFRGDLYLPDVAGLGTWKIVAHYEGDKKHAATLEFQVQKFVLPSFEVIINSEERYVLLERETFTFTVTAKYSYGETVAGSFHSWFRVAGLQGSECLKVSRMIRGLEKTGSIEDGVGTVTLRAEELKTQLQTQGCNVTYLEQEGAELVMSVSVTEQQSSEMQEAEISLPIVSRLYEIDLSRIRSYFIPGAPLDIVVLLRLPDGSPASEVPVELSLRGETVPLVTNQEGAAVHIFNLPASPPAQITVNVRAGTVTQEKVLKPMSSPSQHYLYISVPTGKFKVNQQLRVTFNTINGIPKDSLVYYLVLSHGALVHQGSVVTMSRLGGAEIRITAQMVPSLRLIGYYYDQQDVLVSDSVWVDVVDECEMAVKVSPSMNPAPPGGTIGLEVKVKGRARVALLVVDKAMYALDRRNRLTAKQVFSAMESYDLGCSYRGGPDQDSIFTEAGLSFVSSGSTPKANALPLGSRCKPHAARRSRRALDLRHELLEMKGNLSSELQQCCDQGFSSIPMRRSCEERRRRVTEMNAEPQCADIFFKCCLRGEALRKSAAEDNGFGRTVSLLDIEEYFIGSMSNRIRRNFAPSFAFTYFDATDQHKHTLSLGDSITTWEIQAVILSPTHGFCVVEPIELKTFKNIFVSLRLPYSVRRYEQLSIVAVIHNYGPDAVQLAVHMEQTPGLCSPGSSTFTAFVNVSVESGSSTLVTFAAIPMISGAIPIKIRLYDFNNNREPDAIEKSLNVWTEGEEKTKEITLNYDLKGGASFSIDGNLPNETVPGSSSNLFIKMEGAGFGESSARVLLSAEGVDRLLQLPGGCAEQTMKTMAPTVLALRYLDLSQQWTQLPAGKRDEALEMTEKGLTRILEHRKDDGSYGIYKRYPSSYWLTALVVKVLSLLADRQMAGRGGGPQGHIGRDVSNQDISTSVRFLMSVQKQDGSYSDPHPVRDRDMDGGIRGAGKDMSMTAFIAVALQHAIPFVEHSMKNDVVASIASSTSYLLSHVGELERPYAVAITAYCLAVCLPDIDGAKPAWKQLQALAAEDDNGCRVWKANQESSSQQDAFTVETTAYALLTAVAHQDFPWADSASCWLVAQENYGGGFKSTQDTMVALEALAEYDVKKPAKPFSTVEAEFFVSGKSDKGELLLKEPTDKVIVELKSMIGNEIKVELKGTGNIKMKVMKHFYLMEPKESCTLLNINVTLEGKAQYTSKILDNYQYFDENYDYDAEIDKHRTRRRREIDENSAKENSLVYNVCLSLKSNLTGMAIADITLLSGFEANTEHLDKLKGPPELYISHYEISSGRVILYFNELKAESQCITFEAKQTVPISLLQPAQASFYDYYEPMKKCTIFYSAPKRGTEVSKLCSDDVCQCAERPCHEVKNLLKTKIKKGSRIQHACYHPLVDYKFLVEVLDVSFKSNFRLYNTKIVMLLKSSKDTRVAAHSRRVFANRLQCREQLEVDRQYLIMGKDGSTTDSHGEMQYLLDSTTWVELVPDAQKCASSRRYELSCISFSDFANDLNDCSL
ncbi:complement C4-like isoform X1 [Gadus chalcogrammus]|uniref:complement C4-like isoform X1 n=1 Tax=Gadus chalcogrammus TaxID=1042646 RepID=UPI0024C3169C|nr:complement C4-like isoform X1 [Gadus chalcogrammus]